MMLRVISLALAVSSAAAAKAWVKAGGDSKMCAGIEQPCTDLASCTKTYFGPCETAAAGATKYLQSEFIGLAFVDEAQYLTNTSRMKVIAPTAETNAKDNGYRSFSGNTTAAGGSFAFTMTGGRFGDMATMGGYVGIASYLNIGNTPIVTNTNDFYIASDAATQRTQTPTDPADNAAKDHGLGAHGAPLGPYKVCISEAGAITNGKAACGAARNFQPGEYKFSIFGYTAGNNYDVTGAGFPAGLTDMGIRMKLTAVGFNVADLNINGDKTLSNIGSTDVTKIQLVHATGRELTIDFPTKYNVGVTNDTPFNGNPTAATKDVHIRVSDASGGGVQALFIDYLFDIADFQAANKFFVYDPTVGEGALAAATNAPAAAGATNAPAAAGATNAPANQGAPAMSDAASNTVAAAAGLVGLLLSLLQ